MKDLDELRNPKNPHYTTNIREEAAVEIERLEAMKEGVGIRIADLEAEIERLRAIVARLPHTADGVPVLGGDKVYAGPQNVRATIASPYRVCEHGGKATDAPWVYWGPPNVIDISDCYSTREAAEAEGGE